MMDFECADCGDVKHPDDCIVHKGDKVCVPCYQERIREAM